MFRFVSLLRFYVSRDVDIDVDVDVSTLLRVGRCAIWTILMVIAFKLF
jgi:hypothetical protein